MLQVDFPHCADFPNGLTVLFRTMWRYEIGERDGRREARFWLEGVADGTDLVYALLVMDRSAIKRRMYAFVSITLSRVQFNASGLLDLPSECPIRAVFAAFRMKTMGQWGRMVFAAEARKVGFDPEQDAEIDVALAAMADLGIVEVHQSAGSTGSNRFSTIMGFGDFLRCFGISDSALPPLP